MSTHMQPNPFRQQTSVVSSQQTMVPSPNYSQQQFQPQDTRQRHASAADAEQNVQSLRRINSVPALGPVPQGPVRGGRIMNPPVVGSMQAEGPRRPDHVARQNSAKGSWQSPIIPRHGESLPSHAPNPDVTALHQAVLRSPYLVPIDKPLDLAHDDPAGRYYQAVVDFAVGPVPLPRDRPLRIENFIVPIDTYARVPKDKFSADDSTCKACPKRILAISHALHTSKTKSVTNAVRFYRCRHSMAGHHFHGIQWNACGSET